MTKCPVYQMLEVVGENCSPALTVILEMHGRFPSMTVCSNSFDAREPRWPSGGSGQHPRGEKRMNSTRLETKRTATRRDKPVRWAWWKSLVTRRERPR